MNYKKQLFIILLAGVLTIPFLSLAQSNVVLLEQGGVPGLEDEAQQGLGNYLNFIYQLGIGAAAALAVVYIVWGGIEIMVSDVPGVKVEGKAKIKNAILGLLLALVSYLILATISGDLVNFNLLERLDNLSSGAAAAGSGGNGNNVQVSAEEERIRTLLANAGVLTKGPCPQNGPFVNCTLLEGLGSAAISGLVTLKATCGCVVFVSGGTEPGHATHGPGRPIVDIRPNAGLDSFIDKKGHDPVGVGCPAAGFNSNTHVAGRETSASGTNPPFTETVNAMFQWEPNGCHGSRGDHWHVVFS